MNMYYTGLGIARSLGEFGIPVIGLTAQRGVYGNYTRFAKTVLSPDSRSQPEELLACLLEMGKTLSGRAVLFPTRDDDLVFLDRFRKELEPYFIVAAPASAVLESCLNKWQTYQWALRAGVPAPKCWLIANPGDMRRVLEEVTFPCVLKPVAAHHWRRAGNWGIVGGRKAIGISSREEFASEYAAIAQADDRVLVQELVPGGDDCVVVTACYMDRNVEYSAGFHTQKLVQVPEGFGTGCIVQSAYRPELLERTIRLLRAMRYTGIAEVEYKWDAAAAEYQLIEINPRPWDQHRLGRVCGSDLAYVAYCDYAGLAKPELGERLPPVKWIAEDAFLMAALGHLWRRDGKLKSLFRLARGKRIYAIWSARDPVPFLVYLARLLPELAGLGLKMAWRAVRGNAPAGSGIYAGTLDRGKSRG